MNAVIITPEDQLRDAFSAKSSQKKYGFQITGLKDPAIFLLNWVGD